MIFDIDCHNLQEGLSIVTRALSVRPAQKILEGVLIQSKNTDQISFLCSDTNLSIRASFEANVTENGMIVLPGRFFSELSRKMPLSTVSIKSEENNKVQIKCLSSNSSLIGLNAVEYPQIPEVNSVVSFSISQKKLKDMISKTVFAISTDENRQVFTGGLLELSPSEVRIIALDGFRISVQQYEQEGVLSENMAQYKAIIPGKVLNELSKILNDSDDLCTISINEKHIRFEFSNIELISVLLTGEFIDYRKIIPAQFKTHAVINKMIFQESIDRASLIAREGKNNIIRMKFEHDHLRISSRAEMGEVVENMDVSLDGDPLEIAFNSKYLNDIVKNIPEDQLFMSFNTNVSPCVIKNEDNDDYMYMVLPMRIN